MFGKRLWLAFCAVVLALLVVTEPPAAQGGGDLGGQHLTGSWSFTASPTVPVFPPFENLATFSQEGTLVGSQAFLVQTPFGTQVFSTTHGAWKRIGNREFDVVFHLLKHDTLGAFVGRSIVRGTLQLNESGTQLMGALTSQDFNSDGVLVFQFDTTIAGERIQVEP